MSHYTTVAPRRRINGNGLASVICGGLGTVAAVPIGVGLAMLGAIVLAGVELPQSTQYDLFILLLSWVVAVPVAGVLGVAALITAIVGLFRAPRALPGVGLGLALLIVLLVAAAVVVVLLFSATLDAFEPLLGGG